MGLDECAARAVAGRQTLLVITDPQVAAKYDMHDESELRDWP